jgi:glycosyltransferase involved in cell wall biosynthesis
MKIAYVTTFDSSDPGAWSGAGYQIPKMLESAGAEVIRVDGLRRKPSVAALARMAAAKAAGRQYHVDREPSVLRGYAEQVQSNLYGRKFDALLSPGTIPLAMVETHKPKILWTDCTFAGLVDYYPSFTGLTERNLRDGHAMEGAALQSCDLVVYNCDWAAESAISSYGVDKSKVFVVPFGSSFAMRRSVAQVLELVEQRTRDDLVRLLFVGTDWHRKSGDFAVAVNQCLNQRGVRAELSVIGAAPQCNLPHVIEHGLVSKTSPSGTSLLEKRYRESAFLVHPAFAECNANVFSEACSFGLPILANRTGGIPTSVLTGQNGKLFEMDQTPDAWADYIVDTLKDQAVYVRLCLGAHRQFIERLNWDSAADAMLRLIERTVSRTSMGSFDKHASGA